MSQWNKGFLAGLGSAFCGLLCAHGAYVLAIGLFVAMLWSGCHKKAEGNG